MIVGTRARFTCKFRNLAGELADPDAVTAVVALKGGSLETLSPTRDGAGLYHCDYLPAAAGRYLVRWVGTGGVQAAGELALIVYPSEL